MNLSLATPEDVPSLATLYALVFRDNPAYACIFQSLPTPEERARALTWFFAGRLRAILSRGNPVLVARDSTTGALVGACGIVLHRPSLLTMLTVGGMATWPCAWGLKSLSCVLALDSRLSSGLESAAGVHKGA